MAHSRLHPPTDRSSRSPPPRIARFDRTSAEPPVLGAAPSVVLVAHGSRTGGPSDAKPEKKLGIMAAKKKAAKKKAAAKPAAGGKKKDVKYDEKAIQTLDALEHIRAEGATPAEQHHSDRIDNRLLRKSCPEEVA